MDNTNTKLDNARGLKDTMLQKLPNIRHREKKKQIKMKRVSVIWDKFINNQNTLVIKNEREKRGKHDERLDILVKMFTDLILWEKKHEHTDPAK